MKKILLILLLFPFVTHAQNWVWAKRDNGIGTEGGNAVTTDPYGNVYVTGTFTSPTITYGTTTLTKLHTTSGELFIVKYDASGNVVWLKGTTSSDKTIPTSIVTDATGNVYVAGFFFGTKLILGTDTLVNADNSGHTEDIFLVKYSSSGSLIWAKSAGSTGIDRAYSVAIDASGNAYITGQFAAPNLIFGSTTLTNVGGTFNVFVAKYNSSGNVIWAKSAGGISGTNDGGSSISIDAIGNVYVAGVFQSPTITFGTITLTKTNGFDLFLVKYDTYGNVIWAKNGGSGNYSAIWSVATDKKGNSYVAGGFNTPTVTYGTSVLTNVGNQDLYLVKYDSSGTVLWAKCAGGVNSDQPYSIAVDSWDGIYVTGNFFSPTLTFDTLVLTNTNTSGDVFIAKYSSLGNVQWTKAIRGIGFENANSVTTDVIGNVYMTGPFQSPVITLGGITLTNETPASTKMFLAKLSSSDLSIDITSGMNEVELHPNPVIDFLNIKCSNNVSSITISNLMGQTVYMHDYNSKQIDLDLSNFPLGMYVIRINGSVMRKFLKQ
jgi:hypothetical protein